VSKKNRKTLPPGAASPARTPQRPKAQAARVPSVEVGRPHFSFRYVDRKGAPWPYPPEADDAADLLRFLAEACRHTWSELFQHTANGHRRHHFHPVDRISPSAQRRLNSLGLDDIIGAELFRFHVGGKKRLPSLSDWWLPLRGAGRV